MRMIISKDGIIQGKLVVIDGFARICVKYILFCSPFIYTIGKKTKSSNIVSTIPLLLS